MEICQFVIQSLSTFCKRNKLYCLTVSDSTTAMIKVATVLYTSAETLENKEVEQGLTNIKMCAIIILLAVTVPLTDFFL
jgi:hypothetical protein